MRPTPSSDGVRSRMRKQQRRDTAPEMELRRELHRRGFRYRVGYPVPGMPRRTLDIAFTSAKLGVAVLGCFWHACPVHRTEPQANRQWWAEKLRRNQERDRETAEHLERLGWTLLVVWEHDDACDAADRVAEALRGQSAAGS